MCVMCVCRFSISLMCVVCVCVCVCVSHVHAGGYVFVKQLTPGTEASKKLKVGDYLLQVHVSWVIYHYYKLN